MFTRNGKALTAIGVKPICRFQQVFKNSYLFGAFSPLDGNSFLLNLPYSNADCFQLFLNEFSKEEPNELKVMVVDNGAFHKAKKLEIPKNIILIFLPPYSPELNPAEKMWQKFKRKFTNKLFKTIEEVENYIAVQIKANTKEEIMSICGYPYIFLSQFWTTI
ncbi:MAG: IS630 family transposase [Chitinophagales bacterium]|nr:IS630 family transposase [Chitinophagales bacterium]